MLRSNGLSLICISSYQLMSFCGLLELAVPSISDSANVNTFLHYPL